MDPLNGLSGDSATRPISVPRTFSVISVGVTFSNSATYIPLSDPSMSHPLGFRLLRGAHGRFPHANPPAGPEECESSHRGFGQASPTKPPGIQGSRQSGTAGGRSNPLPYTPPPSRLVSAFASTGRRNMPMIRLACSASRRRAHMIMRHTMLQPEPSSPRTSRDFLSGLLQVRSLRRDACTRMQFVKAGTDGGAVDWIR